MIILFIGDIVGQPGRACVARHLPELRERYHPDVVLANAENAAAGLGVTPQLLKELHKMGIDGFTLGNHTWRRPELVKGIDGLGHVVRPANFPENNPGRGSMVLRLADGRKVGVLNLVGRVFMEPARCPFLTADAELETLRQETRVILVDMHAEATAEKIALGWYLDGRCSAVIGTHTHAQTADGWILPNGTAYLSDAGMCGPYYSVIGVETEKVTQRFLTGMPAKFEVAGGPCVFSGVVVDVDDETGRAIRIETILIRETEADLPDEEASRMPEKR
ncbi:MAG TPA: TIGR00282 family metallophosphoesterase [Candidatus Hydrogenedentes bacterium]|nr:TIGR00282 family metallophosphoesterase [Candidatus Hydrogenedentota bacterium]HOJ68040.1 TIGR00282 family metallophosphoesterase [Candidatus Hydrogenedentota bacterium]HOK89177.1 TIGR00282 family metallophosphoesterase [Candidatus Hydrogenedentota bacterium]HOV61870.1 TIGR00282 family metallophosphoesterase [Candidatus Hydrogenedentota bacterium]